MATQGSHSIVCFHITNKTKSTKYLLVLVFGQITGISYSFIVVFVNCLLSFVNCFLFLQNDSLKKCFIFSSKFWP